MKRIVIVSALMILSASVYAAVNYPVDVNGIYSSASQPVQQTAPTNLTLSPSQAGVQTNVGNMPASDASQRIVQLTNDRMAQDIEEDIDLLAREQDMRLMRDSELFSTESGYETR